MEFEGTTYRPPVEADTMLLQVTVGCAHNKCTYCNMYRDVRFRMVALEQIERDLQEARHIFNRAERIFLVNGDAFVLPASRLAEITQRINHYFAECRTVTMYASINNIRAKSDKELQSLKEKGVDDLYIGIESGSDEVLRHIGKGHTVAEAKKQLERLHGAGINHMALLMLGVAGRGKGMENARLTADFLNETKPRLIWAGTLAVFADTEMYLELQRGDFHQATELEILEEEKALLKNIQLENVPFYGVHPTNVVKVQGFLPRDTTRMIASIDTAIDHFGREALSTTLSRSSL